MDDVVAAHIGVAVEFVHHSVVGVEASGIEVKLRAADRLAAG